MSERRPFIRQYDSRDEKACLNVFYTTIHQPVNFEPARTIGSYLWCLAYLTLTPSTCFVLDDGSGRAVGYIIGTPSTTSFAERWKQELIPKLDASQFTIPDVDPNWDAEQDTRKRKMAKGLEKSLYNAECSMLLHKPELLERYPAHLHIDILPEYQGKEWGARLMDVFLRKMREEGAKGVHLGMVRSNEGAKRFYFRLGFHLCDEVLDGGETGEVGRHGDAVCLVKDL